MNVRPDRTTKYTLKVVNQWKEEMQLKNNCSSYKKEKQLILQQYLR
jgi:hypothetical protein